MNCVFVEIGKCFLVKINRILKTTVKISTFYPDKNNLCPIESYFLLFSASSLSILVTFSIINSSSLFSSNIFHSIKISTKIPYPPSLSTQYLSIIFHLFYLNRFIFLDILFPRTIHYSRCLFHVEMFKCFYPPFFSLLYVCTAA